MPRNVSKKYFSSIGESLKILAPVVYTDDMANMLCKCFQYYTPKNISKFSDIHVSTTGSLF